MYLEGGSKKCVQEFDRDTSWGGKRGVLNWPIHGVWY
jgi:hypothetical protein